MNWSNNFKNIQNRVNTVKLIKQIKITIFILTSFLQKTCKQSNLQFQKMVWYKNHKTAKPIHKRIPASWQPPQTSLSFHMMHHHLTARWVPNCSWIQRGNNSRVHNGPAWPRSTIAPSCLLCAPQLPPWIISLHRRNKTASLLWSSRRRCAV